MAFSAALDANYAEACGGTTITVSPEDGSWYAAFSSTGRAAHGATLDDALRSLYLMDYVEPLGNATRPIFGVLWRLW